MTPPLNILARPSLTVKLGGGAWVLVAVGEVSSCVEVEVGGVAFAGAWVWVEVAVEGARRVEVSLMAMFGFEEVDRWAVGVSSRLKRR